VITGTGLLYDFLKIGTLFWKNEKQVRFSGKMKNKYDFLEKVHFSGKYDFLAGQSTIFWKRYVFLALYKRQGRKYGFTYAPLLEMIERKWV
jgi:hypothetical protein